MQHYCIVLESTYLRMVLTQFFSEHHSCYSDAVVCVPLNKRSTYSLLCAFHLKMLPLMASFLSAKGNLAFAKDCNGKVKESRSGRGIVVDRNKSVFQKPYLEYQNKERHFAAVTNGW